MFVVYSPDGQSFIGSVQQLPMLRVEPAKRINKVEQGDLSALKTDGGSQQQKMPNRAVNAYKSNQKESRKLIVKASELMTSPVVAINGSSSVENAWRLMEQENIKHLPVIEDGELIGICTQKDVLARVIVAKDGQLEGVKQELVADIMSPRVVTTTGDTDVRHLAEALTEFEIGALVVMDDYKEIQGIVTERDLIKRLAKEPPIELYT